MVYRNPHAFPRAWTVHQVARISGGNFDLRRTAYLPGSAPLLDTCAGEDQIRLPGRGPSHLVIQADMQCTGMVVLSEKDYPAWRATVDGPPTRIIPVWLSMRGVVVPAGRRHIEMHYRPLSVSVGALLTALGPLAVWILVLRDRPQSSTMLDYH